ncbi:MAG: hypothetical protein ABI861_02965 [Panacibacter sp.]
MLTHNHVAETLPVSPGTFTDYFHWNIRANGQSLNSVFKKTISFRSYTHEKFHAAGYHIFNEDLDRAMELFNRHNASKGEIPFEMVLRYSSVNLWNSLYFLQSKYNRMVKTGNRHKDGGL